MPRLYLDQVALIRIGREGRRRSEDDLRRCIENRLATVVLSPAHWVEAARGDNPINSTRLAQFMDFLNPIWLLERTRLHRLEIRSFLDGIDFPIVRRNALRQTVTEIVRDINELDELQHELTSDMLVRELRRNPRAFQEFEQAYNQNDFASRENRQRYLRGEITPQVERVLEHAYLLRMGNVAEGTEESQRLRDVPRGSIPSIVIEWEVTKQYWQRAPGMTPNRFNDLQHISVSMPYVDMVLTLDVEMLDVLRAVREIVDFPVATIVGSMEDALATINC